METMILKDGTELEVKAILSYRVKAYSIKGKTLGQMEEILTDENLEEVTIKNSKGAINSVFKNLTLVDMQKNYSTKEIIFSLKEIEG